MVVACLCNKGTLGFVNDVNEYKTLSHLIFFILISTLSPSFHSEALVNETVIVLDVEVFISEVSGSLVLLFVIEISNVGTSLVGASPTFLVGFTESLDVDSGKVKVIEFVFSVPKEPLVA
jgi:hypothetical protein